MSIILPYVLVTETSVQVGNSTFAKLDFDRLVACDFVGTIQFFANLIYASPSEISHSGRTDVARYRSNNGCNICNLHLVDVLPFGAGCSAG